MIQVLPQTTVEPLQLIGKTAAVCWDAKIDDPEKNRKRAWDCINSGHGRVMEWPNVEVIVTGYSAKCLREAMRHIVGTSVLQASTRYINYAKGFDVVMPPSVTKSEETEAIWNNVIHAISDGMKELEAHGVPKEDFTNLLPLAYQSKMVWKVNLRTLVNFFGMRLCNRAYWEIRTLARELKDALIEYSPEWEEIANALFVPKCVHVGFCTEAKSCHYRPPKNEIKIVWEGENHDPQ